MSPRKSNPNGKDHDAERQMRGKKPRSHAVRHPKEAASVQATQTEPTVIEQAAAVLEQERAAETPPVLHPVVNEDERERLREALRRCEAANAELARATDRRKRAQAEVDAANTRLQTVVAEISSGTGQPSLPFSADQAEAERNAMLQADREANTPALIERLKRARFVLTREQLDALDYTQRHEIAEYVKRCEAAVLDGSQLTGVTIPAILAWMHVAGEKRFVNDDPEKTAQYCSLCGCMLVYQFGGEPVDWLDEGIRVGSDCAGVDLDGERRATEEHAAS